MTTQLIDQEEQQEQRLVKFSVTDAAIAELKTKYMPLTISGVDDATGFAAVHAARLIMRTHRTDVEKRRKNLNEDAQKWQKTVNAEARRITALILPIEEHLQAEESRIVAERERLKKAKLTDRLNKLQAVEATLNVSYVDSLADADFDLLLTNKTADFRQRKERERLEAEEAARQDAAERERQRLEQERIEAERRAEEARLEADRRELEAKRKAEEERLAAERAELDRQRKEQEAREAAERARIAEIERKQREEAERLAAEERRLRLEREAAEARERERIAEALRIKHEKEQAEQLAAAIEAERLRRESLRPDREKLLTVAQAVGMLSIPQVSQDAVNAANKIRETLADCEAVIRAIIHKELPEAK